MAYIEQSFSDGEILKASKLNQLSDNIEDHTHGENGVGAVPLSLDSEKLDGRSGSYYDDIPNGSIPTIFYMSSVPTGWTLDTSINNRLVRLVNTGSTGTGGSWTITGLNASTDERGAHDHSNTDSHVLTVNEMPAHNHGGGNHTHNTEAGDSTGVDGSGNGIAGDSTDGFTGYSGTIITTQGGGAGHTHDILNASNHSHTVTVTQDGGWKPVYVDMILATRDK